MSLIRLENVSKSYAGKIILENVSLRIEAGEHVGLIGRNGTGKSTLFKLITGDIEPDGGIIERMKRARYAALAQLHVVQETATIEDIVLASFQELLELERELGRLEELIAGGDEQALDEYGVAQEQFHVRGGYEFRINMKRVLMGLGFHPEEFNLPFKALSGGQRTRLMLALVLLKDADLLLLDEPENHLDLEAREWLEEYLKSCRAAVVIISHDRQMLNTVVDRIVEVERCEVWGHTGNYDAYVKQKALLREQQQAAFERQQEFIRKEQVFIDRFRYKATKAAAVQSRMKRLDKIDKVEAPVSEANTAKFSMGEVVRSGAIVLEARDLSMSYGPLSLYRNVSFQVERAQRIGIIGPNGSGKTTLLRQLAGKHAGTAGTVTLGHKTVVGFYEQNHESMNRANDILAEVHSVKPVWKPEQIRSFMGRFLFVGDDVFKKIGSLSGGELSRVAMAKLILGGANLLMLDEPTNHLDIASREALEASLSEFPGAIVMVSHDRMLIDHLVEKLIILEHGNAEVHLGNYTHYRWKHQQPAPVKLEKVAADDVLKIRRGKQSRETKKKQERKDRQEQRRIEQLERDIQSLEEMINDFNGKFASVPPSDYSALKSLNDEYEGLKADLKALYQEWETLAKTP